MSKIVEKGYEYNFILSSAYTFNKLFKIFLKSFCKTVISLVTKVYFIVSNDGLTFSDLKNVEE